LILSGGLGKTGGLTIIGYPAYIGGASDMGGVPDIGGLPGTGGWPPFLHDEIKSVAYNAIGKRFFILSMVLDNITNQN
jgi:hypothetical protein